MSSSVSITDDFWLNLGYRKVDGVWRNQVWINNQSWINPEKYKEICPQEYAKLVEQGFIDEN